jgi:hypothetical protein
MAYLYDIFISYKRGKETNLWIREHFQPLIEHCVELELGRKPTIYRDDQLSDGATWPVDLGIALGSSRVLVPLWTKTYFHSDWCVRELSVMLDREKKTNRRTPANSDGLVIPIVLHNYEIAKPELKHVQYREIRKCFNVRMQRNSERAEQLADELLDAAPGIAKFIENAPEWEPEWPHTTAADFLDVLLQKNQPQQNIVPGYSS